MEQTDVIIVGAGVAGLTCARALQARGRSCLVLESAAAVGGRIRTDVVDGFHLDRGFQVLLTAYPAAREWLDFPALQLGNFAPGARVATPEGTARLSDPWRAPGSIFETLRAPVGTLGDKLRIAALRFAATAGTDESVWHRGKSTEPDAPGRLRTTAEELDHRGFSPLMRERFLRPWLGGIFLERELATPASMLFFIYRMFSQGYAALPAGGMQRIPEQLAAGLSEGSVRLNTRVVWMKGNELELLDGTRIAAKNVVLATEGDEAARIENDSSGTRASSGTDWRTVTCVHWAADASPLDGEPVLWLNGTGQGQINNLAVPSDVAAGYAPAGKSLVSTTLLGAPDENDQALLAELRTELVGYFGAAALHWQPLGVKRVRRALPRVAAPGGAAMPVQPFRSGLWVCGDHTASASIQGAMESGAAVARALLG